MDLSPPPAASLATPTATPDAPPPPAAGASAATCLELVGVTRRFGAQTVLDAVDIAVPEGSFTALLGASGCGKSTTLRIMAGLDRPTSGRVVLSGRDVTALSASERNVAMVFQSYALYPHLTVAENIALPLAMRRLSLAGRLPLVGRLVPGAAQARAGIRAAVGRVAELLDLGDLLDRKPASLSGGQQQRVALARAMVREPVLFLLDEPLSNLDARLRVRTRAELVALHRRTGRPFVLVTHDQGEAMTMADRIVVMIAGRVAQAGSPRDLYERPATRDVAAFIGANPINLFAPGPLAACLHPAGARLAIGIRPEHLHPAPDGPLEARLEQVEYLGSETVLRLRDAAGGAVRAIVPGDGALPAQGSLVRLAAETRRLHPFDPASGRRVEIAP